MLYLFIPIGYLLGSIPFGLLLTKLFGYGDIRDIGSGNIGTTNVLRTGNKVLAAITLLCDSFKGAMAVWMAFVSADVFIILAAGFAAIVGHMYPIWLKFRGGKGVATTLGTLLAVMPPLFFMVVCTWVLIALVTRLSSLAALAAFALAPIFSWLILDDLNLVVLMIAIDILVLWKHKENIKRLIAGTENRLNFGQRNDENAD